ncbi:MAG TPA: sigma-70 family RNA polymerase sigma factor [Rubricoccaceae bacterium]|nr:sigma-70 family RNA polymerase sigma factor [Rubricoccaceae bacterium]
MHPLDPQAVARAQAGDGVARERILTALQPLLRGFFVGRIGHREEVDDLVQNTLLRIHRGLSDLVQPDRLRGFAMKAALFELNDFYRGRYSARETLYDPDSPPDDPTRPDDAGLRMDLERALATLSPRARRIIELRELGYPYLDIAELLGTTEAAVKMQVKRAFERLREVLTALLLMLLTLPPAR